MSTNSIWRAIHDALSEGRNDDPPTAEEMEAYRNGELDPEHEARVRAALVASPELARAVAQSFPPDEPQPGDPDYVSPAELNRRWSELQRRLQGSNRDSGRVLQFFQWSAAVAASVAIALGVLLWKARSELAEPRVAWEERQLLPDGRRGAADTLVPLELRGESVLLVASLFDEREFAGYRVDINDPERQRTLWSSAIARREDGSFSILVPRRFLQSGTYQLVLYGVEGRRQERLSSYSVYVPRR